MMLGETVWEKLDFSSLLRDWRHESFMSYTKKCMNVLDVGEEVCRNQTLEGTKKAMDELR